MSAFEAVRRHWLTALLPLVVFLGAAAALAVSRPPVYTAQARLAIGGIDLTAPGALSGFSQASQSLASTYSRAVTAEPVVQQVAQQVGADPDVVRNSLSASPVPMSPVFSVSAETGSSRASIEIANSAADALRDYVTALNKGAQTTDAAGGPFLESYRRASNRSQVALNERDKAQQRFDASSSKRNRRRLARARADFSAAQVRLEAQRQNYLTSSSGQVTIAQVQRLTSAVDASSDRLNYFAIYLFIGAVAGGLAGVALATLRGNRALSRQLA